MESRTEFNPSKFIFNIQLLKDFLSLMRKKSFSTTGIKINVLKNNCNLLKISHHILSMTVHHLPPVLLITDILLQELSRMSFVDMPSKLVIMFLEDSVGIVTDFQLSTKLIRNLKLLIKDKFWKWVLPSTTKHAEISS